MTTITLETSVRCCPCALRGIPLILCILTRGSGRRSFLSCCVPCCSCFPCGRHSSKRVLGSLGRRHDLCLIGRACSVRRDGLSTVIEVDYLVRGAALSFFCLFPFRQLSLLSSLGCRFGGWTRWGRNRSPFLGCIFFTCRGNCLYRRRFFRRLRCMYWKSTLSSSVLPIVIGEVGNSVG